jgi:hypothetical protein
MPLISNGLCISAKRFKGLGGDDKDVLLLTRRWLCNDGSHPRDQQKNFLDTDPAMRLQQSKHLQQTYPFNYQSDKAGLTNLAARTFDCLSSAGTSVTSLVNAANDMRQRNMLDKFLAHSSRTAAVSTAMVGML